MNSVPRPKVCFFLQRNFALVGHELAVNLKDDFGFEHFCAYVSTRPSLNFIENQKQISYTPILFDDEIHNRYLNEKLDISYLEDLEKEYGVPYLWPYLFGDRVLMFNQLLREYPHHSPSYTDEEMLRIVQVTAKAIINFLETEKPDVVIFSVVGALGSILLHHIAEKKGIKTIMIFSALFENQWFLSKHFDCPRPREEKILFESTKGNEKWLTEADDFIEKFLSKPTPYYKDFTPEKQSIDRRRQFAFLKPQKIAKSLYAIWSEFRRYYKHTENDYTKINPWHFLVDRIKRKIRNLRTLDIFYDVPNSKENYVFFPLQYEPEVSLTIQAPNFSDQLYTAKLIARSLPVGYKLYIKEHPQMVEFRERSFYRELKNIPNIRLINPAIKGVELVKNAKLITVITSTVGWEACILGKPVVTLGNVFYNDLPFVKHTESPSDLPYVIQTQLREFKYERGVFRMFLASILKQSANVDFQGIWMEETNETKRKSGLKPLAELIAKRLLN